MLLEHSSRTGWCVCYTACAARGRSRLLRAIRLYPPGQQRASLSGWRPKNGRSGQVGDHHSQGGLAGAGWTPKEDRREQPVSLDGTALEFAWAEDIFLTDELVERARAHSVLHGVIKEVHTQIITRTAVLPVF